MHTGTQCYDRKNAQLSATPTVFSGVRGTCEKREPGGDLLPEASGPQLKHLEEQNGDDGQCQPAGTPDYTFVVCVCSWYRIHAGPMSVWVVFGFSGFLPQSYRTLI